jgi:clan AA aspartic protease (TIGR02281 family)
MKLKLEIPIVIRRVKIDGTAGSREIDMVLDTGAVYTVIAWDVAKDIGYDPAISERRMPIITANGIIEAPLINIKSIHIADLC